MVSVEKAKKATEKKPKKMRMEGSHQQDIPALTVAQMDAIRKMEPQEPVGPMVSSILDF